MKYTPETVDRIIEHIEKLGGRINAAQAGGISFETFCQWFNNKPEFADAVKKAEDKAKVRGKEIAIKAIFNAMPKYWTAAAWWLERNFPDEFKERKEVVGKSIADLLNDETDEKPDPKVSSEDLG